MNTILSVNQVAKRLHLSAQQVRAYCRDGRIKAVRINKSWIIPEDELKQFELTITQDHPLRHNKKNQKPIVLSFFSGAMGLDIGLERAGLEVLLACEIDKACRRTIQVNKPNIALLSNIADYTSEQIMATVGMDLGDEVDLIIGGPPCHCLLYTSDAATKRIV